MPHERAEPPVLGPRRGARGLPRVAAGQRRVRRRPHLRRRGLGRRPRPAGPLHPRRRAAHGVQLRVRPRAVGRGGAARGRSTSASRRRRSVGAPDDLGAVQPRRDPARHALRPAGLDRRRRLGRGAGRTGDTAGPGARAAPGPGGHPADARRCPARRTSTRARSSACPRSWTCPRTCSPTRSGSAPGTRVRGRDGCRVPIPWTSDGPSLGFGTGAPWLPQPADWAELSVEAEQGVGGLDPRALPRRAARTDAALGRRGQTRLAALAATGRSRSGGRRRTGRLGGVRGRLHGRGSAAAGVRRGAGRQRPADRGRRCSRTPRSGCASGDRRATGLTRLSSSAPVSLRDVPEQSLNSAR